VFLNLIVTGCATTIALDENFKPKPIPKIDYSAFQRDARPEIVANLASMGYQCIAYSPDGRLIATAEVGLIQLWNPDGKLLKNFQVQNSTINIAFSPDGQRIVSAGLGGLSLTRIDGSPVWEYKEKDTQTVAYSPDGGLIASAGWDKTVKLWRPDGTPLGTLAGHKSRVQSVAISPDGGIIASGSDDKTIKLWNAKGQLLKTLRGHTGAVTMVKFRPDGKLLASCSDDKTVRLWSITGRLLKTLRDNDRGVGAIDFSSDGEIMASAGLGGITLRNNAGKLIRKTDDSARWIEFHPGGKQICTLGYDALYLRDLELQKLVRWDVSDAESIRSVAFSPNGTVMASGLLGGQIKLWGTDGTRYSTVDIGHTPSCIAFRRDGALVAVGPSKDMSKNKYAITIVDAKGRLLAASENLPGGIGDIAMLPDRNLVVTGSSDKTVKLWRLDGSLQQSLTGHADAVTAVAINPEASLIASGSADRTLRLWNSNGKLIQTLRGHTDLILSVAVSPEGRLVASGSTDNTIRLWSVSGRMLKKIDLGVPVRKIVFAPNGKYLAAGLDDNTIMLLSPVGRVIKTLKGHHSFIYNFSFSPDAKFLISGSLDTTTRIWDIHQGGHVAIISTGREWIMYTHDGYFAASRNGGSFVTVVKGLKAFAVDQFALTRNRPDIILGRLGSKNVELSGHYYRLYKKRLQRAGVNERRPGEDFHIPEAKILKTRRDGKFVEVDFKLSDSKYNLKQFNIYVNDVPILGAYGQQISGRLVQKSHRIELTRGVNKIEIVAVNAAGTESHRAITTAVYDKDVTPDVYYIGFGVSKYRDRDLDLGYADKDARDLANLFGKINGEFVSFLWTGISDDEQSAIETEKLEKLIYSTARDENVMKYYSRKEKREIMAESEGLNLVPTRVYVKTYLNDAVTVENIKRAKAFLRDAKVDDVFVLFIAGHGVHDTDRDRTYYYLTHDTDLKNLPKTAANFELIEDLLHDIAPRRKLFLMDTCESGVIDDDLEKQYLAVAGSQGIKVRTTRAIRVKLEINKPSKRKNGFFPADRNRFIYNDLSRRSGAIVFSSSRGNEFSYESQKIGNGFFTEAIIRALTDKSADRDGDDLVNVDELRDFVSEMVAEQTGGNQHPVVDRDNIYQKFGFPFLK